MTIRLFDLSGVPLPPYAADTHHAEFYAWRVGSFHVAHVIPDVTPRAASGDGWTVLSPRSTYGSVVRQQGGYFKPINPQGGPLTAQESLFDALGAILPA